METITTDENNMWEMRFSGKRMWENGVLSMEGIKTTLKSDDKANKKA